jgi:transposase
MEREPTDKVGKMLSDLPQAIEGCHDLIRELVKTVSELFVRIEKIEIENRELRTENRELRAENNRLKEQLNNNSSNTSLPPSKDFKRKKHQKPASQNKSGGQVGHKGHYRELLSSEEVDTIVRCPMPSDCLCGGKIDSKESIQRHQVYELPEITLRVTEYQLEKGCCLSCGASHSGELPTGITWGITGPRLTAFMSQLVSNYGLSRRELTLFLKEHLQFDLSLGSVFNKQKIVNAALEAPVLELLEAVKQSPSVHADETSHNRDGKKQWLWGFISLTFAFFSIEPSRGKKVVKSFIGDFKNTLISDRYSAYDYFDSGHRQLCWAHLKRDFTRLSEKADPVLARIGKNLLLNEGALFKLWHEFKDQRITREELLKQSCPIRQRIGELLEQGSYTDPTLKAAGFCKNLLKHFDALWTFLSTDDVEPTNNHAERSLRHSVIWRKKYFTTRSDYGSEFVARTASVMMTCRFQSKNSFQFLTQTLTNYFLKTQLPSLVPRP